MTEPVLYRISVHNEFKNTFAYVDFKQFGDVRIYAALYTAWPHRGYTENADRIRIYINRDDYAFCSSKHDALLCVIEISEMCPEGARRFLEEERYKLFKAIGLDTIDR
jgi:hypothetical protein